MKGKDRPTSLTSDKCQRSSCIEKWIK